MSSRNNRVLDHETKIEVKKGTLAVVTIVSSIIVLIVMICFLWKRKFSLSAQIESDVFGQFGDFVGGVIGTALTLLSIMLLYYTFILTKQQIESQQIQHEKEQIEARFFELLKIHRDNAETIREEDNYVFKKYVDEINRNYNSVKEWKRRMESTISHNDIINISYLTFFYGIKMAEGRNTIKEVLLQHNPQIDTNFIEAFIRNQITWGDNPSEGHEMELGHYFRHLYQIVKYINERNRRTLSYKEKYEYIKILRAQLTAYEQIILFWDSLSPLGISWEFKERNSQNPNKNRQFITKYNLIKNIPAKFADEEVKPNLFYTGVKFDWLRTPSNRDESIYF